MCLLDGHGGCGEEDKWHRAEVRGQVEVARRQHRGQKDMCSKGESDSL
jgi:hypothetical protein